MFEEAEVARDLVDLVVPQCGGLVATGERQEPFRLVDGDGLVVAAAAEFFCDLQAAGRPDSTIRSYGLDLLRWFRFLWAAGVSWERATRAEAGDFCRWMTVEAKRGRGRGGGSREPYSAAVRAHAETVLRGFYDFHLEAGSGPIVNPFPLDRSRRGGGARASELLSAVQGGVHPGRRVIAVTRKGTRRVQELPASADAFVWLRLYQG